MQKIHDLSGADFEAFEADMYGAAEQTFDQWVASMEVSAVEGWRECEVWIKESVPGVVRLVDVGLDGMMLYQASYGMDEAKPYETGYTDFGGDRPMYHKMIYNAGGWVKQSGWMYNEFTDGWIVPEWVEKAGF